jgi:3D-(3,5/4)-trihydroxycyclohexane-1,2-dione acylhydrolase (decyclizing)
MAGQPSPPFGRASLPAAESKSAVRGEGSYLMMNSEIYGSVLTGHKLILIVCDNGGFAVIERLQVSQGGKPFMQARDSMASERAHQRVGV